MKTKHIAIAIIAIVMLSSPLFASAVLASASWPKLPSNTVQLSVVDGTDSYFISTLSGVPGGFDVYNGEYAGWCVDMRWGRLAGDYDVLLYSSLAPPVSLQSQRWDIVNYILNHKQGLMMDVQRAIWYFVKMDGVGWWSGASPSAASLAMVANALANGNNYVPGPNDVLAIICYPTKQYTQISIIELLRLRGKVTGGGQCIVGENEEIPSASFGFNAMWFSRDPSPKGEINYVDHITGQHVHVHDLTYLEVWQDEPGNKPWPMLKAKFGGLDVYSGHMVDVYVEDHGEPGKNDKFLIFLNGQYLGGSGDYFGSVLTNDPILAGNIQIHKPPK
jgi:hypothetical protein